MVKPVQKKLVWTPEDKARHQAIRAQFAGKPTIDELVASGELTDLMTLATYLEMRKLLRQLKEERTKAGLSLTGLAERTGMDKAFLSRLENGRQVNPTLETLDPYARAIGKELVLGLRDQEGG